jgi:hypothetical protein
MTISRTGRLSAFVLSAAIVLAACAKSQPVATQSSGSTATTGGTVLVAAGTDFYGKLQQPIGTKTSKDGDTFTLVDTDTLFHKNPALQGAVISGHLTGISAAGPMKKPAMTIVFDRIQMPDGTKAPLDVQLVSANAFEPKTHHLRTIGLMIGGAMAGHMANKHGGLVGAAAGYVLSQELRTDIAVPAGTVIELRFKAPVTSGG